MSPVVANFLFEAANFLVLAAALGWVLFKPTRKALEDELAARAKAEAELEEKRAKAAELAQDAKAAKDKLEGELQRRREALLAEAREQIASEREAEQARQQTAQREAEQRLRAAQLAHTIALAEAVGEVAGASVRALLQRLEVDGQALDLALVRRACQELRALPDDVRKGAMVESACELSEDAVTCLREVLPDMQVPRVVPELGAGVRISTGSGQVDASAQQLARQLAQEVTAALKTSPSDAPEQAAGEQTSAAATTQVTPSDASDGGEGHGPSQRADA